MANNFYRLVFMLIKSLKIQEISPKCLMTSFAPTYIYEQLLSIKK